MAHPVSLLWILILLSGAVASHTYAALGPASEDVAVTVYSSAHPGEFDPQRFIAQQTQGSRPHWVWQVPGFGVVKEVRSLNLQQGENEIRFTDIAQFIDPTTVSFSDLSDPRGTFVLEQNFEFDLINPQKIYEKYIDQEVQMQVVREGESTMISGRVLAVNAGRFIIQTEERLQFVQQGDARIRLPVLPLDGLVTKPTLVWKVHAEEGGDRQVRTTYQTDGITWRADYNLILNDDDSRADLGAWVSLMNLSGIAYKNAQLKLIAGDVQRVQPRGGGFGGGGGLWAAQRSAQTMPGFEQRAFFEYHLYTLPRRTDILSNQTQQIMLFPTAHDVGVEKVYVYYGLPADARWSFVPHPQVDAQLGTRSSSDVDVYVQFENSEEYNLGMPLPRRKVRVYKMDDADQTLEFVGEDLIDHTPRNEDVLIKVGRAFDLVGERTQTHFSRAGNEISESFRIQVRNHKDDAVEVIIRESLFRWLNWEISESSMEYEKIDSRTIHFAVNVPPNGEQTVTYTVRYTW